MMKISPPIGVLAILAVGLASAAWLAPLPRENNQTSVMLSSATYQKLTLWGKAHADASGRPQTVAQAIETLANSLTNEIEIPEHLARTNLQ
jgi:hypothetical protein